MTHILMIAAENGALAGGKIGGIGDVVRDIPKALAKLNCRVTVLTPSYGSFNKLPGATKIQSLETRFAGELQPFDLYELTAHRTAPSNSAHDKNTADTTNTDTGSVRHIAIDHPLFSSCGKGQIYCHDRADRPFATDASKFALFCTTAAEAIGKMAFDKVDVIHLHDWHAAFLLILRRYDPVFQCLQKIRCCYTIHNLALQGIRPLAGDASSLEAWFPDLKYQRKQLADPRWSDCVNPMATAIRLADAVQTVSPSYADEILLPSDISRRGYYGGEGLEKDLREARDQGRLFGILNGCDYPEKTIKTGKNNSLNTAWKILLDIMQLQMRLWIAATGTLSSSHFIAQSCLDKLNKTRPGMLLTSVGRVSEQKMALMLQPTSSGEPALDCVLNTLGKHGLFIMVGSGDYELETLLTATTARFNNFIFLRGYSDELAAALYNAGDLFFMPSSFEPCGISQMLALRQGQPVLVHAVGGLRDTVVDNETGFSFSGDNPTQKADNLVATMARALTVFQEHPLSWKAMRKAAAARRFEWTDSVKDYLKHLYQIEAVTTVANTGSEERNPAQQKRNKLGQPLPPDK